MDGVRLFTNPSEVRVETDKTRIEFTKENPGDSVTGVDLTRLFDAFAMLNSLNSPKSAIPNGSESPELIPSGTRRRSRE